MENGSTILEKRLDTAALRNFVLFPLPSDNVEYSNYLKLVKKRFPPANFTRWCVGAASS
jgi:hypothetical protein